jgi:PAT family beta-lactamase induction signal transducer AmpG
MSALTKFKQSPWAWVPTLYFAEGIPYFIVNNISVLMLAKMGVPNGQMALFTSLLYLPWTIKPFWSPFVDLVKTKRWWTVAMQFIIAIAFACIAFTLPTSLFFELSLAAFWLVAFTSATHDIAADGYYMHALDDHEQSLYVGIRSTFYRIATVAGQGLLVILAGFLEEETDNIPFAWMVTFGVMSALFFLASVYHQFILPRPVTDKVNSGVTAATIAREFAQTFITFFTKKGALIAITFMLLYRLPEALLVKMISPFMLDPVEAGGLGLKTEQVGIVYGTVGIIGLTIGGILGGIAASHGGL